MKRIIPRTQLGLPARVTNIDHVTTRRMLQQPVGLIVCHYTGVARSYRTADLGASVRSIHRWRANEYNYVLHMNGDIGEFAGHHQAAHAKGFNDRSYGVLFLNGVPDECTDAQVESFRWLVDVLRWVKAVVPTPMIAPHQYVGKTACPGRIMERWNDLTA